MSKTREALEAALEVLEQLQGGCTDSDDGTVEVITVWCPEIIEQIQAALAEPDQEPVYQLQNADGSWIDQAKHSYDYNVKRGNAKVRILYTSPREWQEPCAMRYDFDGFGWKYIDSGSGSDWRTRIKDAEPVYPSAQPRKWQGLSPQEAWECYVKSHHAPQTGWSWSEVHQLTIALSAALRAKNGG